MDRIKEWNEFAEYMESVYLDRTVAKYGGKPNAPPDLMHFTDERICVFNILKYALRLWNYAGKHHDFEKIAHYAQIAHTMRKDKMPKMTANKNAGASRWAEETGAGERR